MNRKTNTTLSTSAIEYALETLTESREKDYALLTAITDCMFTLDEKGQPTKDNNLTAWWLCELLRERLETTELQGQIKQILLPQAA